MSVGKTYKYCQIEGCRNAPRTKQSRYCATHRDERFRCQTKEYVQKKLAEGKCRGCAQPREDLSILYCSVCRNKRVAIREDKKARGICVEAGCNNSADIGRLTCAPHGDERSKQKAANRAQRIADGICTQCSVKESLPVTGPGSRECFRHTIIGTVNRVNYRSRLMGVIGRVTAEDLTDLYFRQNSLCAISGLKLTLGVNAELDHIIPLAKGGTNTADNIRWVHWVVNQGRMDAPDSEFIEVAAATATHQSFKNCQANIDSLFFVEEANSEQINRLEVV